jgi:hypothetical protein
LMVRAKGFEHLNATPRWGVACPRLDGDNTIIFFPLGRKCKQIPAAPPTKKIREFERVTLLGKSFAFRTQSVGLWMESKMGRCRVPKDTME